MFLRTVCCPDLVLELSSLLTIDVLENAIWLQARVEFALDLAVRELAVGCLTVTSVAARRHGWMFENASSIGAIWPELAILLGLLSRRWVPASAFSVFARCTKRTFVSEIDCCTLRSCRRLMCERAICLRAVYIKAAGGLLWINLLLLL
jgi:hypothetical protein